MICIETRQTKIYLSKGTDYSDTLFAYIDYVIGLASSTVGYVRGTN